MIHIGIEISGRQVLASIDDLPEVRRSHLRQTISLVQKIVGIRVPALIFGFMIGALASVLYTSENFKMGPTNWLGLVISLSAAIAALAYSIESFLHKRKVSAWVKQLGIATTYKEAEDFLRECIEADQSGTLRRELETRKSVILTRMS